MTILEADAYTGLEVDSVRPGARVRHGVSFKTLSKDQAFLYRAINNVSVPNAPGVDVATAHVHDGTTGCIIPIPLATGNHYVNMVPASSSSDPGGWARLVFVPFYVPAGVDTVRVVAPCSWSALEDLRVRTYDQSLTENVGAFLNPRPFRAPLPSEAAELGLDSLPQNRIYPYADLNVTPGEFNVLLIEGYDGYWKRGTSSDEKIPPGRIFYGYSIFPEWSPPMPVPQYATPLENDTGVVIPGSSQHLGAYPFTSINDTMTDDDRALSTYLANAVTLNDGLLQELLVGQPVGGNTSMTHGGHNHADDAGSADPRDGGAVIDQPLGSWFFGVGRSPPSGSAGQMTIDEVNNTWSGRIYAPTLKSTAPTSTNIPLGKLNFRMPQAKAATFSTAASDIRVAYLAYNDTAGTVTMKTTLRDKDGTGGTSKDTNISSTGAVSLTVSSNVIASAGDEEVKQMFIEANWATAKTKAFCVYGAALGLVA